MSTTLSTEHNGRTGTVEAERPTTVPDEWVAVSEPQAERGAGWITFAAIMLGLGGVLGLIDGIVAVSRSSFYVAGARFVFSDLNTWGWIIMGVGVVTIFAALAVLTYSQWARWFGIAVAGLQAIGQLMMIQAYPFWSLCVFAIDVLVIYALAAYGGPRRLRQ